MSLPQNTAGCHEARRYARRSIDRRRGNLTPAGAHAAVTRMALNANKAVFSEKPLGIDFTEGVELVALANQRSLGLGCAPDTVLGAGLQAERSAIDRGLIGTPIAATGFFLGFGPEWWHPNPEIFYTNGAGPLFNMGPYYLTTFCSLFGPATSIMGSSKLSVEDRMIHAKGRVGESFAATAAVPAITTSCPDAQSLRRCPKTSR